MLGGAAALRFHIGHRLLGVVMAFGAGVLISAVAFELVLDAYEKSPGGGGIARPLGRLRDLLGGDALIDRSAAPSSIEHAGVSPAEILLGIVLDGVPESIVLGLTFAEGGEVGVAFLAAVWLSEPSGGRRRLDRSRGGRLGAIPDSRRSRS